MQWTQNVKGLRIFEEFLTIIDSFLGAQNIAFTYFELNIVLPLDLLTTHCTAETIPIKK